MRLALVGYGRMGKEIHALAQERGHQLVATVDPHSPADATRIDDVDLSEVDCVIEFALADGVLANARAYAAAGVPAVVGTTGWEADEQRVRELVTQSGIAYLYGSNFSVGANLLFALVERAGALFDSFDDYDTFIQEAHHSKKKDSPSGTAVTLANKLLRQLGRKDTVVTETLHRAIEAGELQVSSVRGGAVPGQHRVVFDSVFDSIEIIHTARNRKGFATGAVRAAEWLAGRSGFFTVDDFIADVIGA
ncbi:MAG: 4-hydroxy-tetrahydrodipicolinate reductase [Spirochaetes bacterium]|nr:4-hydroxy-tetrahydrodipicolinate reductase [Spirochaetota bacterium]